MSNECDVSKSVKEKPDVGISLLLLGAKIEFFFYLTLIYFRAKISD
jgi:hypothetical protein